ncbi:MAG: hypothetical protein WBH44_03125, partial [Proteocatella sp.]
MMKKLLKKLLIFATVGTVVFTFSVPSYAEGMMTEVPAIDVVEPGEPVTEEIFSAVVTLLIMEDEYNLALNENGVVVLIEGSNEELSAALLAQGTTLNESIQKIVADYGEEATYTGTVSSNDKELAATVKESLKEVFVQEVETEISRQPDFIAKRFAMAKELGITPGKMNLLEKLRTAAGDEISYEDWAKKPVKEIMSEIKSNKAVKDKIHLEDNR